ncbi:hypothetical protein G9A89_021088 [Geosiphon pyriformis]|nr:hypothetical protein G9A89_021088 [Geosiphon pyriformis]
MPRSTINITLADAFTSIKIPLAKITFQNFGTVSPWKITKSEEEKDKDQEFNYQNLILENPNIQTQQHLENPKIETLNIQTLPNQKNQNPNLIHQQNLPPVIVIDQSPIEPISEPIQPPQVPSQQPLPLQQLQQQPPQQPQQPIVLMAYAPIAKLEKFTSKEDDAQAWLNDNDDKALQAIPYFLQDTADSWYQSLVAKPQTFDAFKQEFLRYFSNNNSINCLVNTFITIKQEDTEAVTMYLGQFHRCLCQIQAINADYFIVAQVLNQFIRGLCSSILQRVRPLHPADLQAAVTNTRDFEAAELEANHVQAVNLVMNRSSELDSKLKQFSDSINQKLKEYLTDNRAGNSNHIQNQPHLFFLVLSDQQNYAEDASSIIESTKRYHFPYPPNYKSTETEHPQKYIKVVTIRTIGKDHSSYRKALFQYFRKDLGIPAGTTYAESDFCNYINAKIDCLLGRATDIGRLGEQIHQTITETLCIIDTDIKYYVAQRFPQVQQPVESNSEEYENKSNNPITAQAKSMVNKKPRVLFPTTFSYHQTPQSRIVFNPPLETQLETPRTPGNSHPWNQHSWTKLLEKYGLLFGNLTPAASQTEGNSSTWEQPPAQNLAESASPLTEETAILQPIGSSDKGKQPVLAPGEHSNTRTPIPLNITSNTPPINQIMAYRDIVKLKKFSGKEDNAYSWIVDAEKAITANGWNNNHTYQSLAEKPTFFTEFKLAFLQYFSVTTYLRQFNQILCQILVIERDYYTMVQVLNQFIKKLRSSILRSIRPRHLTSLQDAITLAHDFESTEQEELTNHPNGEKITITADTHSNKTVSNSNNLGDLIPTTATTARNLDTSSVTAEGRSWTKIKEIHTSNPDINKTWYPNIPYLRINHPYTHNNGLSQPIPREDQGFDKSTPVEGGDIERISQPSKQTKSNISPATITKDTTLATIFPFNIDNLNTHSLFSEAAINQDKPIMALYTNARVGGIDIKLILNSGSAINCAATAQIITADGNTKTPIGEIDNFPFKINGIQIPTKVLIMEATQYQALVGNDWLSKANAALN